MKIEAQDQSWKPVTVELTFESLQELQEFYAIMNHAWISRSLKNIDTWYIKDRLADISSVGPYSKEVFNAFDATLVQEAKNWFKLNGISMNNL